MLRNLRSLGAVEGVGSVASRDGVVRAEPDTVDDAPHGNAGGLHAEILRDARQFETCWGEVDALLREAGLSDESQLNPRHFVAMTDGVRRPCPVVCRRDSRLVGVVYLVEYHLRGMRTGYVVGGDFCGRGLLVSRAEDAGAVMQTMIAQLIEEGVHAMHLRWLTVHMTAIEGDGLLVQNLEGLIPGDRMRLLGSRDEFLAQLGKHTRRNIRYCTRKAIEVGIEFVPVVSKEEYEAAVMRLNVATVFHVNPARLARDERLLALYGGGQRLGLRAADGLLVAVLCGFCEGERFYLLTQLNDAALSRLSLSLVLRGWMVEPMIAAGVKEWQFVGGTALSLGRFCKRQEYRSIFVDRRTGLGALWKWGCSQVVRWMNAVGAEVPDHLKLMCNGRLQVWRLMERTALSTAMAAGDPKA